MGLQELVEISRRYGADPDYVLAGGGNTSFKDERYLYIKPSGTTLAELSEAGVVQLDRARLDAIWRKRYSSSPEEREREALADLMAARAEGEAKRPSVETLLHELLERTYVVHLHPALVNGLTCARNGEAVARELFREAMIWIPVVNPGYVLASHIRASIEGRLSSGGSYPSIIFLENHGVFVASDAIEEIERTYERIMRELASRLARTPDVAASARARAGRLEEAGTLVARALETVSPGSAASWTPVANGEIERLVASEESFAPLRTFGYTPDHLVYCKAAPVWLPAEPSPRAAEAAVAAFLGRYGAAPRIIALEGLGVIAAGESTQAAGNAGLLFTDLLKILCYGESFGGAKPMPPDKIEFILGWEVESYRSKVSHGEK